MTTFTSAQLTAIADGLRTMSADATAIVEHLADVSMALSGQLDDVDGSWSGERSRQTLEASRTYATAVEPAHGSIAGSQTNLELLAVDAEALASTLQVHESTLATAESHRSPEADPDGLWAASAAAARRRIEELSLDWLERAVTAVGAIALQLDDLEPAYAAFASGFPATVPRGDDYLAMIVGYAATADVDLSVIDPSGAAAAAAAQQLWFLRNTPIGEMYFEVIETSQVDLAFADGEASPGDLELASTDPQRVRQLLIEWGEANRIEFDDATLDHLVAQITFSAAAMRVDDSWEDDDGSESSEEERRAAVLGAVSGVSAVVGLDLLYVAGDPVATATWWSGTSSATQETLIQYRPAVTGNTNGLPAGVRDEANRIQLDADLLDLEAKEEAGALTYEERELLENVRIVADYLDSAGVLPDPLTGAPPVVQLYAYDPAAFGLDGRAAIALGDVDTADHVAVSVPGFSSDMQGMRPGRAHNVYVEATLAARGEAVAVIDWMGYDAPNLDFETPDSPGHIGQAVIDELADMASVLDQSAATAGAESLAADVAAIDAMRADDPHVTVIGNSYGSTTTAIAATDFGLAADDVVLSGSPGAGTADSAEDLTTGTEHTWIASASSDPITWLGHNDGITVRLYGALGNDPAMDTFDAQRMQGENLGSEPGIIDLGNEHGSYYDPRSESLYNISAVVAGEYGLVEHADPRDQEGPFGGFQSPVTGRRGPFGIPIIEFQSPVDVNLMPLDPEESRRPRELTHAPEDG